MKTYKPNLGELYELLIQYAANGVSSSDIADKLGKENSLGVAVILGEFIKKWEAAPCEEEGANESQDEYLDNIVEDAAKELLSL